MSRALTLLAVPFALSVAAHAQGKLSAVDAEFVQHAAAGGMAEVEAGQLAQTKAQSAKVKTFAQHMVDEHTANNMELASVTKAKGVMLPMATDAPHEAQIAKLKGASGATFDKSYIAGQVTGHEQMEQLMRTEVTSGTDADLKAYAQKTLPAVQQHLTMAKQLAGGG